MGGRKAGRRFRDNAVEAELAQIERIDERVDHANRIALVDKVIEALGKQCRLASIGPSIKRFIDCPRKIAREIIAATAFLRSQGQTRKSKTW